MIIICADNSLSSLVFEFASKNYNATGIAIYACIVYLIITSAVAARTHLLHNISRQYILINLGLLLTSAMLAIELFSQGFMSIPAIILCGESLCDIVYLILRNYCKKNNDE